MVVWGYPEWAKRRGKNGEENGKSYFLVLKHCKLNKKQMDEKRKTKFIFAAMHSQQ
jgi:hypothetical protein